MNQDQLTLKAIQDSVRLANELGNQEIVPLHLVKAILAVPENMDSLPEELDELERHITQLEIERQALKKENNSDAKTKLKELLAELEELKIQRDLKAENDKLRLQQQDAERRNDYDLASQIQYGRLPENLKESERVQKQLSALQEEKKILNEEITEEDIAEVVSRWNGVGKTETKAVS